MNKNKFINDLTGKLEKQFGTPCPEVSLVAKEYLGITSEKTAKRFAKECRLPIPSFTIGTARTSSYHVNLTDLAELIYERYTFAKQDYNNMSSVYEDNDIVPFTKKA